DYRPGLAKIYHREVGVGTGQATSDRRYEGVRDGRVADPVVQDCRIVRASAFEADDVEAREGEELLLELRSAGTTGEVAQAAGPATHEHLSQAGCAVEDTIMLLYPWSE